MLRLALLVACTVTTTSAQSLTERPNPPDSLLRDLHANGNYRAVVDSLRSIPTDSLSNATLKLLGQAQTLLSEVEEAVRTTRALKKRDSLSVAVRFDLARLLTQSGRSREAVQEYEDLLRLDSSYTPALIAFGDLLSDRRAFADALRRYHRALVLNRRNARLNFLVGRTLVHLELQDSAVGYLAAALTLQRDHVPSMVLLASIHYGKARYEEASRLYRSAVTLEPDNAEYLMSLGLSRLKLKDPRGAAGVLRRAVDCDQKNALLLAVLGQALFELERYDSAAVVYRTAATLDPDNPSLWLNLALTLGRLDSISRALPAMEKAIAAYQPEQIAYAYRQLGALLYNSKKFPEALTAYERSLLLNSDDLDSRFFHAATLDRLGKSKSALSAYRKYLTMAPDKPAHEQHIRAARSRVKDLSAKSR